MSISDFVCVLFIWFSDLGVTVYYSSRFKYYILNILYYSFRALLSSLLCPVNTNWFYISEPWNHPEADFISDILIFQSEEQYRWSSSGWSSFNQGSQWHGLYGILEIYPMDWSLHTASMLLHSIFLERYFHTEKGMAVTEGSAQLMST